MDAINNKLDDKESKEGIRRIFDLFIGDPNADTIALSLLKKISKELGGNMSDEELKIMLERASKNGVEHLLYKVITITWTSIGLAFFRSHSR